MFVLSLNSFAQSGQWVWLKGDSTYGNTYSTLHSFGVKGIYSDTNIVPKLYGSSSWSKGNRLFLLGGSYLDLNAGFSNDVSAMWEYNVDSNMWRWISGEIWVYNGDQLSYWGTQGVPDSFNFPIFRENSVTWTDLNGNFWLFGGHYLSDMWKYDVEANLWTWMNGTKGQIDYWHYGIKGVSDSLNNPPARYLAESWTDKQGNLWMFGGEREGLTYMNDLWKYNIASNEWTWIKGDTVFDPAPVYGALGIPAPDNTPEGRINNHLHWVDSMGKLYLFGGWSQHPAQGYHYDIWKFNITLYQWAQISNEANNNYNGDYITKCETNNSPASRTEATGWTDSKGYFWLYGGDTNYQNPIYSNSSNDLWKYDPYNNLWWWIAGDNIDKNPGFYDTQGLSKPANVSRSRFGSASWVDSVGNFWVWGGTYIHVNSGDDYSLNDLWRYVPDSTCGVYTGSNGPFSLQQDGFIIAPNPAISAVTIVYSIEQNGLLTITNAFGATVKQVQLAARSGSNALDVSDLAAGIYFVRLQSGNQMVVKKMVKE